jgi:hypothetical protein
MLLEWDIQSHRKMETKKEFLFKKLLMHSSKDITMSRNFQPQRLLPS